MIFITGDCGKYTIFDHDVKCPELIGDVNKKVMKKQ
jgi:hypothetical protein